MGCGSSVPQRASVDAVLPLVFKDAKSSELQSTPPEAVHEAANFVRETPDSVGLPEDLPCAHRKGAFVSSPRLTVIRSGQNLWYKSFLLSDPRQHLVEFFKPGDERGPYGFLREQGLRPHGAPSHYFAVWRPTSITAIRKLFVGSARGKGCPVDDAHAGPSRASAP